MCVEKVHAKLGEGDYEAALRLAEKNLRLYESAEGTALLESVKTRMRRAAVLKRVRTRLVVKTRPNLVSSRTLSCCAGTHGGRPL